MKGNQYYFGALHGELDYYLFVGEHVAQVLNELTQLTGRTLLKPKYVFGYHQGGYGPNYNNKWSLMQVALQYREAKIPCDGMHVDVDFQNNYRTFTHSPTKFPNPKEFFNALHDWGYKVRGHEILSNVLLIAQQRSLKLRNITSLVEFLRTFGRTLLIRFFLDLQTCGMHHSS